MSDRRWLRPCSLMGCPTPDVRHHHHWVSGHLSVAACTCPDGGEPGYDGATKEGSQ